MSDEEFKARVGTKLRGKWSLDRLIGIGGMAAVYAATHKIGRTDAIKLLDPEVAVSEDLRARFEQEALAVNSIGHPGTVEIRDIDTTEDGTPFLVMELLEGETLAERAAAGRCQDTDNLLRLIDELLDVLVAAHAKGIIHRDIKPENLFVQQDGSLKVLDFGIARMRDGVVRTLAGTMLGTVAYMPPEQIKGEPVDRRADLFSVGATMFRLIAGRPVHEAEDEWKVGTKMLTEPAPPLAEVAPKAPQAICWIVDRALAFQRGRRYPNAATMRADIRAAQNGDEPPYALARLEAGDDPRSTEPAPETPEEGADTEPKGDGPERGEEEEGALRGAPTRSDAPPPP
ncbi:MAG: serine/threonine protein kinase, partial [Deltaproteobacteria bacterium]|nr:serine/threonine protein kinase [Deltaproteobacteria bacterium]MBW2536863.1 serine/threonine protein kinase [Deltaproteobacteria bacterium]